MQQLRHIRIKSFNKKVANGDGKTAAQSPEFFLVETDWRMRTGAYETEHAREASLLLLGDKVRGP